MSKVKEAYQKGLEDAEAIFSSLGVDIEITKDIKKWEIKQMFKGALKELKKLKNNGSTSNTNR